MPDFVGTYELAGEPPEKWNEELRSLASSAGIEVRLVSKVGRRLTLRVRVPESETGPANDVAGSFFGDVLSVLSGPDSQGNAQFTSMAITRPPIEMILRASPSLVPLIVAGCGLFVVIDWADRLLGLAGASTTIQSVVSGVAIAVIVVGVISSFGKKIRQEFAVTAEREQQAVQERALVKQVVGGEDPKLLARIELARIALRMRASSMRGDADRLWKRSVWASRGANLFFLLAIAGPGVAAVLVLTSPAPDWHFMFGGLSLAAVPLGIGTALLRHDTRLREQYQESARDVAALERYELALDYARIASTETYQSTIQQVIAQLLSSRTGSAPQPPTLQSVGMKEGEGEDGVGAQKLISTAIDTSREVVASLIPKKGA